MILHLCQWLEEPVRLVGELVFMFGLLVIETDVWGVMVKVIL